MKVVDSRQRKCVRCGEDVIEMVLKDVGGKQTINTIFDLTEVDIVDGGVKLRNHVIVCKDTPCQDCRCSRSTER